VQNNRVIAGEKLAHTWHYIGFKGDSLVSFELFSEGNKTRLRLTHSGLETFPYDHLEFFAKESFGIGWTEIIGESLKNSLETNFN